MNLATIILLLQMAIGLLAQPNLASNPALQQQATQFADQAIALATAALALPSNTELGTIATSTSPSATQPPIGGTGAGIGTATEVPAITAPAAVAPVLKTISVSFATSSDGGVVKVINTTGVAVRVKSLGVNGTLSSFSFSDSGSWSFSPSFEAGTQKYDIFKCEGLGSLGTVPVYGDSNLDPCKRKDDGAAKNELQPGETITLNYGGTPTGITYQPGSIVEVGTGADVQF